MAGKKMFRTDRFKGPLMRVSYAFQLFKPRENTRDTGEVYENYGCSLIAPNTDLGPITDNLRACIIGEWGDKGAEMFKNGLIRNPILAGDGKEARNKTTGEINPGLGAGLSFIRVSSGMKPKVFDADVLPIADADDLPSGSWGYPVLNAYAWHNPKNGNGVSFGIEMFQLVTRATGDEVLGGSGGGDPGDYFEKIDTGGAADAKPTSAAGLFG